MPDDRNESNGVCTWPVRNRARARGNPQTLRIRAGSEEFVRAAGEYFRHYHGAWQQVTLQEYMTYIAGKEIEVEPVGKEQLGQAT